MRPIERADHLAFALDENQRFTLIEGVIAEGDDISTSFAQLQINIFGDAKAMGSILAVHDDKIWLITLAHDGQLFVNCITARFAYNIT